MMIEEYDSREGYCRKLGHYVFFQYCRIANNGIPCSKILDCWFETLPIQKFMLDHFNENLIEEILTSPAQKITTILDIVDKVQKDST